MVEACWRWTVSGVLSTSMFIIDVHMIFCCTTADLICKKFWMEYFFIIFPVSPIDII